MTSAPPFSVATREVAIPRRSFPIGNMTAALGADKCVVRMQLTDGKELRLPDVALPPSPLPVFGSVVALTASAVRYSPTDGQLVLRIERRFHGTEKGDMATVETIVNALLPLCRADTAVASISVHFKTVNRVTQPASQPSPAAHEAATGLCREDGCGQPRYAQYTRCLEHRRIRERQLALRRKALAAAGAVHRKLIFSASGYGEDDDALEFEVRDSPTRRAQWRPWIAFVSADESGKATMHKDLAKYLRLAHQRTALEYIAAECIKRGWTLVT